MEKQNTKKALALGARIGTVFLLAVTVIVVLVYHTIYQNFQTLLVDYTIKLINSMAIQGVKAVEGELENGKKEATILAAAFKLPESHQQPVEFARLYDEKNHLRLVYVSDTQIVASDGRSTDVRKRQDIETAFKGEPAIYGPYFNKEKEFVMCYSAPIWRDDKIVGVLSVEKDGYAFSRLIESLNFVDSGESYIINADGTDIAVSRQVHIEWVTSEYNARKLYEKNPDEETKSILDLEQRGLNGESGVGHYYWNGGLCYVVYEPIPSVNWVLLTGMRDEEIIAMTESVMIASISRGPVLGACLFLLSLLTGLIIFWIIASMKKNAEINEKLEVIANHDSLTGLLNRHFLENNLLNMWQYPIKVPCQAAVFLLDIDNFKQYNDFYGHPKGDDCLRCVSSVFKHACDGYDCNVLRYGGEEFVAVIFQIDPQAAAELGEKICRLVEAEKIPNGSGGVVTVSVGVCYINSTLDVPLFECIKIADNALYQAKKDGKNRSVIYSHKT